MTQAKARFPRDGAALGSVFQFVEDFVEKERLDATMKFNIDFALEEIFTNMVKYNPTGGGDIEIRLGIEAGQLTIAVTDFDTHRFDVNADAPVVDINKPLADRKPGGLGVHLIKTMMDRVEYDYADRVGTITLTKRLE